MSLHLRRLALLLVVGLSPWPGGETRAIAAAAPACALGVRLAERRAPVTERLAAESEFRAGSGGAAFAAWLKVADRELRESGDAAALGEWARFRGLDAAARAADPAFGTVVAEYALARYRPDLEAALTALVACRNVGTPIGAARETTRARAVLDSTARRHEFTVMDTPDGGALTLSLGTGAPRTTFRGYVDVPPAGAGWSTDPWRATFSDSAWVGRGVAEGKGPALAALFALRAAADAAGIAAPPAALVLRLDALTSAPPTGAADDGVFLGGSATPAGLERRAQLTMRIATNFLRMQLQPRSCLWRTDALTTSSPGHWVPDAAEVVITPIGRSVNGSTMSLQNRVNRFVGENSRARLEVRRDGDRLIIVATGRPAPATLPELGQNPIIDLAMFLQDLSNVCTSPAALTTLFLAENVAYERSGRGLGISRRSAAGVGTTLTVTDLGARGDSAWADLHVLHPGVLSEAEMLAAIRERLTVFNDRYGAGLEVSIVARVPAVMSEDPAAAARLATIAPDCSGEPLPPPAATEWPGHWALSKALPLGTLSPPDRPNNLTDERTTPSLVVDWMARVLRATTR